MLLVSSAWASFQLASALEPGGVPDLRSLRIPEFERPGRDSFFVYSVSDELSQMVLFHDLGRSIASAREADVLFIGNSRMPLGLREEIIVPAAEASGLRAFSIACGHSDKIEFALELIRKHDLRPRIVVVSGGPHVFIEGVSKNAERAMQMSRWQAWKEWIESSAAWAFQSRLHAHLPKIDLSGQDPSSPWIVYRSSRTGWWQPALEPDGHYPVQLVEDWPSYDATLALAGELKRELDERGAQLVLTLVPYGDTRLGHLPYIADELAVPAIVPSLEELSMADGSHLNRDSARRISEVFWREFIALTEVRAKLGQSEDPKQSRYR